MKGTLALCCLMALGLPAWAKPKIVHEPPEPIHHGKLEFKARISAPGGVFEPYMLYRLGGGEFHWVPLVHRLGEEYEADIRDTNLAGRTIEYYLGAYDKADLSEARWHSPDDPARFDIPREGGRRARADDEAAAASEKQESPAPEPAAAPAPTPPPAPAQAADSPPSDGDSGGDQSGSGSVTIVTEPAGAAINFDGDDVGKSPVKKVVDAGDYLVAADLDGYHEASMTVTIKAGATQRIRLVLKRK